LAFTLANGFAYIEAAVATGLDIDDFAPRLSFFFNAHMDFFEEIAKFRPPDGFGPLAARSLRCSRRSLTTAALPHPNCGVSLTANNPK